ncbi:failed axon connections homolog [Trichomycterus rosablanca]|uniref:failed axon connections homolog n=1 Tax=Trichomycterus rosablanca TaxID=2290929 RepID=UPI002F35BD76
MELSLGRAGWMCESWWRRSVCVSAGALLAAAVYILYELLSIRKEQELDSTDAIILHQFSRPRTGAPSLHPLCLKIETYLRMVDLPYQNYFDGGLSAQASMPWMEYNHQRVSGTEFMIEFLEEKLGVSLDKSLSLEDIAVARTITKLVEEHLHWTLLYCQWVERRDQTEQMMDKCEWMRWTVCELNGGLLKNVMFLQGIGRFSTHLIHNLLEKDLRTLSTLLGDKKYIMGLKISSVDAAVFGHVAQAMWTLPGSKPEQLIKGELKNLARYCERIRTEFWPEWRVESEHWCLETLDQSETDSPTNLYSPDTDRSGHSLSDSDMEINQSDTENLLESEDF